MPFTIRQRDDQYCVHREFEDGSIGDSLGCHDTRNEAVNQIAAIEANENKMITIKRREDGSIKSATACGDACKFIDSDRVGGYGVVFTDETNRDLHKQFFDSSTYYGLKAHNPIDKPFMLDHAFDVKFKSIPVGIIDFVKEDEIGLWLEAKLHEREQYEAMLKEMRDKKFHSLSNDDITQASNNIVKAVKAFIGTGKAHWSTGALPQAVDVNQETGHIKSWPLIEGTAVMTPAEPNGTEINFVKSAFDKLFTPAQSTASISIDDDGHKDIAQLVDSEEIVNAQSIEAIQSTKDNTMATKNLDEVIQEVTAILTRYAEELGVGEGDVEEVATEAAESLEDEIKQENEEEDEEAKQAVVENIAERAYLLLKERSEKAAAQRKKIENKFEALHRKHIVDQPAKNFPAGYSQSQQKVSVGENLKYAHLSAADMALAVMMRQLPSKQAGIITSPTQLFPEEFFKAMAHKMSRYADEQPYTKTSRVLDAKTGARHFEMANKSNYHLKAIMPFKADELDASVITGQGLEWVGEWWSTDLWMRERFATHYDTMISKGMMEQVIPQGAETAHFPLEGNDPVAYVAPQARSVDATGRPETTINISPFTTGEQVLTPREIKIATAVTVILEEDSVINVVQQVNRQLQAKALETRDQLMVNGDTETGTTNINNDGVAPATGLQTPYYIASDGYLKVGLANGRDASNILNLAQYRLTLEQLDPELRQFYDRMAFMIDPQTEMASLAIPEIATEDVRRTMATVTSGRLLNIFGVDVLSNGWILQADTDGKVTAGANVANRGRILLAYAPYWGVGFKRGITLETVRDIYSGSNVFVMSMRLGFIERGTNAAALSFNIATAAS
jgi:hypothetical protein